MVPEETSTIIPAGPAPEPEPVEEQQQPERGTRKRGRPSKAEKNAALSAEQQAAEAAQLEAQKAAATAQLVQSCQVGRMIAVPLDLVFSRVNPDAPKITEEEIKQLDAAAIAVILKYSPQLEKWLPEIMLAGTVFMITVPRLIPVKKPKAPEPEQKPVEPKKEEAV